MLSGESAVPCNPKSAPCGAEYRSAVNGGKVRTFFENVEDRVLCDEKPRTWSGLKGSSHKWPILGDTG